MSPPTKIAADESMFRWYAECLVKRETRHHPSDRGFRDIVHVSVHPRTPWINRTDHTVVPCAISISSNSTPSSTELVEMTGGVRAALKQATEALLDADVAAAEAVISGDLAIDEARERIEDESFDILARQSPGRRRPADARRLAADGHRPRADGRPVRPRREGRAAALPRRARCPRCFAPTITSMADTADEMIAVGRRHRRQTATSTPPSSSSRPTTRWTSCARSMFRTLLSEHWDEGVEPAVDMALLGRYYERIGDHAVSMARRIVFLVTGQHPATV